MTAERAGEEASSRLPEMWAGFECTVRRVGDHYADQIVRTGHHARTTDLDLVAALGVRRLRYPVLWTRIAPHGLDRASWGWSDERLARLRELGIAPIVGLVHHGSGPPHTSLVDESFAHGLEEFARAVAERYPWLDAFTPVNEPLTTARFSGLYGHWYPHGRDDATFVRALLVQCRAVVAAMRAIRTVLPHAVLVQTEDLGKVYATRALAHQAAFENERRWLSFDLLCGRVDEAHPMRRYLLDSGASERELDALVERPCPPDVVGINHYLSGERFLDERLERYPDESHGGNGRQRYADVLAARVCRYGPAGPAAILREAWERYRIPVAITEAHNGCTREEQLRWLRDVWEAACALRREGADVRAVTAWSLLGAYDWDSLMTRDAGVYESGVFDLAGPRPRPTALAPMVRGLATEGRYDHPVLDTAGWWRRPERLWYPSCDTVTGGPGDGPPRGRGTPRTILITGAGGALAHALTGACLARGLAHRSLTRSELDVADPRAVAATLAALRPWAVVNAAGYVHVDAAEQQRERCFRANATGPGVLAAACAERGVALLTFSSGMVFDGARRHPYLERDASAPLSTYGRAKAEGERRVLAAHPEALVVRSGSFFGHDRARGFAADMLRALARGRPVRAPVDQTVSPTYLPDVADKVLDLLVDGASGIWHLANGGGVTWAEFARVGVECGRWPREAILGCSAAELDLAASRPSYCVLDSERARLLPPVDDALARYLHT